MDTTEEGKTTTQAPSQHKHTHAYHLCGASTRPGVYYLQYPEIQTNVPNANDWWRVEYSTATGNEAYILRERLSLSSVLERINTEHKSALIVYANDAALSPPPVALSETLAEFVKTDNIRFLEELSGGPGWDYGAGTNTDDAQNIEPIGGWNTEPYEQNWPGTSAAASAAEEQPPHHEWDNYGVAVPTPLFSGNEFYQDFKPKVEGQGPVAAMDEDQDLDQSSASAATLTLTPNSDTEVDEVEMREVNSRIYDDSPAGGNSNRGGTTGGDVDMMDVPLGDGDRRPTEEMTVQHIEDVEKKESG
jgi:hypothetical protein